MAISSRNRIFPLLSYILSYLSELSSKDVSFLVFTSGIYIRIYKTLQTISTVDK